MRLTFLVPKACGRGPVAGHERARLRLVERAARRRVSRGRLQDVVDLECHGEDLTLRGGGRVHLALAKYPRLGLRGGNGDGGGLARLRKLPRPRGHGVVGLGPRLDAQPVVLLLEVLRVVRVLRARPAALMSPRRALRGKRWR